MTEEDLMSKLLKLRIIPLGEIVTESTDRVKRDILTASLESDEPIILLINSPGGIVTVGFSLIDFMMMLDVNIVGIVSGRCSSMAVPILQACSKRLSTEHSYFFLHPMSTEQRYWHDNDLSNVINDDKRRWEILHEMYLNFLMRKAKKTREEVDRTIKQGEKFGGFLSAKEALEWGFIDEILFSDGFKLIRYEKEMVRQPKLVPIKLN